jgi:TatD DNase family protein
MVDTHCHLADDAFAADAAEAAGRARDAGVHDLLCVLDALEPVEHERAAALAAACPGLRTAIGVHPHRAGAFDGRPAAAAEAVRTLLAADPLARAVGEIGLDYHYDFAPRPLQRAVFAAQVALAGEIGRPIVIHTREADADTLDVLKQEGGTRVSGVFHCFSGDVGLARAALDLGFYVSFSGIVTFPRAAAIHEAARLVPDDRLLAETDCPYLAPVPHRGRRNEPAWVQAVAGRLGDLRGVPAGRIADIVTANYLALFRP